MNNLIWIFKEIIYLGATASILILIILLIKKIFNKALSPKWHYYIWVLLLIRLLVPFYPQSSMSIYTLLYTAAVKVDMSVSEIILPFQGISLNESSDNTIETLPQTAANVNNNKVNSRVPSSNIGTDLKVREIQKNNFAITIMAFTWIIGVILLSLYTIYINIVFIINVHKRYTPLNDERINGILKDCKKIMKIKHTICLYTSKKVRTPSLYGFFNTKILISKAYMEQLSNAEIKYIFLHELSHYKRKDIAINWILALLQIIYFFNPLIWYAFYKIHQDCEISCDAAALRYISEVEYQSYGSTIIKLIRLFSESNFISVTAGMSKNKLSYKRRIIMISKFKKSKWTSNLLAIILIFFVGLIGLTGCQLSTNKDSTNNTKSLPNTNGDTKNKVTLDSTPVQQEPDKQSNTNTPEQAQDNKNIPTQTQENTNTPKQSQDNKNVPKQVQITKPSTNQTKEVFYGQWVIKKVLAYGSVGTYSNVDANSIVGKNLSFSADKASCFGDKPSDISKVATNPIYKKTVISKNDFETNYRITFDKLGIKADSISEITVSDSKGNGCTFFIKDNNILIIYGGGTYFELLR